MPLFPNAPFPTQTEASHPAGSRSRPAESDRNRSDECHRTSDGAWLPAQLFTELLFDFEGNEERRVPCMERLELLGEFGVGVEDYAQLRHRGRAFHPDPLDRDRTGTRT